MASFSFGAGNARKLLSIPLYALGRVATLAIPRSRDRWVFGCAVGVADGALALWNVAADDLAGRATWLVADAAQAAQADRRGIPWVRKNSVRGFWCTARARVVVVTHGFGDVQRYAVTGAFVVQLWHGIPLKRIGLDSPVTLRSGILPASPWVRALLAWMYRGAARRISLVPAASHRVRGRLESAFALADAKVPVTGEPRVDVLSAGRAIERRRSALASFSDPSDAARRRVLYAPTWRDGEPDPAVPDDEEWQAIAEVLERHDAVLHIRSHPLGAGEYAPPAGLSGGRIRMLGTDLVADVTPLLPGFDALVTDYSSLVFDSALVPLPVVFLAPDIDRYAAERGFYGSYRDIAGDDVATSWAQAAAQLDAVFADPAEHERRLARARTLDARMHAHRDGGNAARVYRAILVALADERCACARKAIR
ncbi:CDP-glycerol glycerophosphotransferase family protein [Microbacterium xanthum]|uniref:CDP-glycerol glycerophosphotransferase family protein n=1 Tax=Microbacterium xanthum TaxID=3079794 RepID=UPI002AD41B60|nr:MULTISPECIES: CDP-glycerol glycerophosphotransferase family protein [unclassified Microbacterium]MDZ8172179.1 CDP-glycerol glycerophosphotransferase family protein [Microbacterium sp. KSW-48]MDZ8202114.1 CDP-glycerol glycerophosphotransferase family protein [Microbacterium sp. SSW1-59]